MDVGVGGDVLVGDGTGGVGGNPRIDRGVKEYGLVGIVGDLVGLGDSSAGF